MLCKSRISNKFGLKLETVFSYSCHTADSKPVKQEVNGTVILTPLVFPGSRFKNSFGLIWFIFNWWQFLKDLVRISEPFRWSFHFAKNRFKIQISFALYSLKGAATLTTMTLGPTTLNTMRLFCPLNSLVVNRNWWLILLSKIYVFQI